MSHRSLIRLPTLLGWSTLLACWMLSSTSAWAGSLAIADATIYPSPEAAPLRHATIVVTDGKVAALGTKVAIPQGARVLPCSGCTVFAGFWNCHVHFMGPQWVDAAKQPAAKLTAELQKLLTHSGFTTVVDTGSVPENTVALRSRVESDVLGPRIFTAGLPLYPPDGIPYYLAELPASVRARLPQPRTPAEVAAALQQNFVAHTDLVKLFTGSWVSRGKVKVMPLELARAAVELAHRHHQLVFAHPSDKAGIGVALDSGVDVLAHAPDDTAGVDEALVSRMAKRAAMIPTLKLFSGVKNIGEIRRIVGRFHALGGRLLFGTDTGFLPDPDVGEEYRQLGLAGLGFREVLAMLTTAPAAELGLAEHAGVLRVGADGDLTVLAADPARGRLEDFTRVRYAIRAGRVIFAAGER